MKSFSNYVHLRENNLQLNPNYNRDFLGYYISKSEQPSIIVDPMYGTHFSDLLDNMPNQFRNYALQKGWLDAEIEDNDETAKEIAIWLNSNNIGMIFVSHDKPWSLPYEKNAFYVLLPEKDRLSQIVDTGEIDGYIPMATSIVLFDKSRPPKFIPIKNN